MRRLKPGYYEIKPGWNKRPTIHIQKDDNIIIRIIKTIGLIIQTIIRFIIKAITLIIILILIYFLNYYMDNLFSINPF